MSNLDKHEPLSLPDGQDTQRPKGTLEAVDANDWNRYVGKLHESQRLNSPNIRLEHSSPSPQQNSEASAVVENGSQKIEIQAKPDTTENSSLSSVQRVGSTSSRTTRNEFSPISAVSRDDEDTDSDDISDEDGNDNELKIAFHKAQVIKLIGEHPVDMERIDIHLKALIEQFKDTSDVKMVLLLAITYLGGEDLQLHKCKTLLDGFKARPSNSPEDNLAGYLARSIVAFRFKDYNSAYKDCRRVLALSRKNASAKEADQFANQAAFLASSSAAELSSEADRIYYDSLYNSNLDPPGVWVEGNKLKFPSVASIISPGDPETDIEKEENKLPDNVDGDKKTLSTVQTEEVSIKSASSPTKLPRPQEVAREQKPKHAEKIPSTSGQLVLVQTEPSPAEMAARRKARSHNGEPQPGPPPEDLLIPATVQAYIKARDLARRFERRFL